MHLERNARVVRDLMVTPAGRASQCPGADGIWDRKDRATVSAGMALDSAKHQPLEWNASTVAALNRCRLRKRNFSLSC